MPTSKNKMSAVASLKFFNFRMVWIGLFVSSVGTAMQLTAINWHVYLLTKSAVSLALVGVSRVLPIIILAPLTGLIADLINRKKLIILAQVLMTFCALALFILTFTGWITPLLIYILIFINSVAIAIDIPARHSIMPQLVPKEYFTNATSLTSFLWRATAILGPAIAGMMIAQFNIGYIYLINAISFLAIIFVLIKVKITKQIFPDNEFSLKSIKDGFRFVFRTPLISSTMLLDFFATFFASATVLLPIYAKDILLVGPQGFGILSAAASLGGTFGGIFLAVFNDIRKQGWIIIVSVVVYGLATIGFGISKIFLVSFIFLAVSGFCDAVSSTLRTTIRQLITPDHIRGRMNGVNMIFFYGGPEMGEVEAGLLAAGVGAPLSVVVGGLGAVIATIIIALKTPKLLKYEGNELI